jgi:hypothetical protein
MEPINENYLNITEKPLIDESVVNYQYREYEPQSQNTINAVGEIRIEINNQDAFTHPSESYLHFEGQIQTNAGAVYGENDRISLINNAIMYMFTNIRLQMNNQDIETLYYPGHASTMIGLLKYSDDFASSSGLMLCWKKDTSEVADNNKYRFIAANTVRGDYENYNEGFAGRRGLLFSSNPRGSFAFDIPMNHIFGFCEDYKKVMYGIKYSLYLSRRDDSLALFRSNGVVLNAYGVGPDPAIAAVGNGRIVLSKISWFMPHVEPGVDEKNILYKVVSEKTKLPLAFRGKQVESMIVPVGNQMWSWSLTAKSSPEKPRWIIVGFQTDKNANQTQNPAIFNHCSLTNAYVMLNSERYPLTDLNQNFTTNNYSRLFKMASEFKKEYYGIENVVSDCQLNPSNYKTLFPLIVFDTRKQSERLKGGITSITLHFNFSVAIPANTTAFAVVISDKIYTLESDGSKFNVITN